MEDWGSFVKGLSVGLIFVAIGILAIKKYFDDFHINF